MVAEIQKQAQPFSEVLFIVGMEVNSQFDLSLDHMKQFSVLGNCRNMS